MQYQIRKRNSLSKRYVRPKTFDAVLDTVGGRGPFTTFGLTLCDPRTKSGEGYDFQLSIAPEDTDEPLMVALIARIYAMMSCKARAELSRVFERVAFLGGPTRGTDPGSRARPSYGRMPACGI